MKKVVSLLLIATLLAMVLCSCGSSVGEVRLLALDEEHVNKLIAESPYYASYTINESVYGTDAAILTVGVGAIILVSNDLSDDQVYALTKDIFENPAALVDTHAKYAELSLSYASSIEGVPYHNGAAKYFEEKGYDVAAKNAASTGADKQELRFVTGGSSGTYYAFGQVLANHATNNAGVTVTALTGNGSKSNVEAVNEGSAELCFCQSDVMAYAYNGERLFDESIKSFSVLGALYIEQVQIVTLNDDVKSVADLAGKKVSIGSVGSGVYFNAVDVLGAYGLTVDDIKPTYQSFGDSADALKNGQIDAAFIVAGAPTTAVTDLFATKG